MDVEDEQTKPDLEKDQNISDLQNVDENQTNSFVKMGKSVR